jgi:hypothetical protein
MMEPPRPQHKVSLEDILRLKRAERPDAEFWVEFEDQLRHKQLAAIVDKRPWWRRFSSAGIAKFSLPLGATVIVAFTLFTFRDRSAPTVDANGALIASAVSSPSAVAPIAPATPTITTRELVVALENNSPAETRSSSTSGHAATASSSNRLMIEGVDVVAPREDTGEPSLAQVILGIPGAMESDARPQYQKEADALLASVNMLEGTRAQTISSLDVRSEPEVATPRDDRRARLLASVNSDELGDMVSGNSGVARSRDRIASRLTEQSLYDSIRRLGLNGDSVSIKF